MPDELLDRLGIDAYVVLTAEPGDVALRRSNDGTRRRDDDPLSEISRDQGEELAAARRCAEHGRAPLYVIDTTGSSPERNGDRLYELVRQVERYRPEGGAPEAAYGMC
jgi:adenylate kinase